MKKYLVFIVLVTLSLFILPVAQADINPATQPTAFLSGKMLVVDMNNAGKVSKEAVLAGSDLILGTISNDTAHKEPAFKVEAIGNVQELSVFDSNHDGIIERDELAKSNLVLIRFSADHAISIIPLALSNIQQIHYQGGATQNNVNVPLNVWLETNDNKKYMTYYLVF